MSIAEFRDLHRGADVFVLAAGGSLNYLDPEFFNGKLTVSLNNVAPCWPIRPTYALMKEEMCVVPNLEANPDVAIVKARFDCANPDYVRAEYDDEPRVHVFDHQPNRVHDFDVSQDWPTDPDHLVVSASTVTTAMHFAAYLGAANIILVGHDCGVLGNDSYVATYWPPPDVPWLATIEAQTVAVKNELARRYGVRVYSLNPFINFNLEGTPFRGDNLINVP